MDRTAWTPEGYDAREGAELASVDGFAEAMAAQSDEESLDGMGAQRLWPEDKGTLPLAARKALLHLVRGPLLSIDDDPEQWEALVSHRAVIESQLANLFLCLVLDELSGIAFVRNAYSEEAALPKAVRSQTLNLMDTIVILTLRILLLIERAERLLVGKDEIYAQVQQFKPVASMDPAAFQKAYDQSWQRMKNLRILIEVEGGSRCEVSGVLRLIFGADEVRSIAAEFDRILKKAGVRPGDNELLSTLGHLAEGEPGEGKESPSADGEDDDDVGANGQASLF